MRTTLDIDDDVLQAVRERARRERRTMGEVISGLARRGLSSSSDAARGIAEPSASYGFRPLPKRGSLITNETIDRLREDDAY